MKNIQALVVGTIVLLAQTIPVRACPAPELGRGSRQLTGETANSSDVKFGKCDLKGLSTAVDEAMRKKILFQSADSSAAGGVVAVVLDDAPPLLKSYGCADVRAQKPVDAERTLFRVGSVSKLITATAVLHLAESGNLGSEKLEQIFQRDIAASLDFPVPPTFAEPITLMHLLTHTSGLEDRQIGNTRSKFDPTATLGAHLSAHFPARVRPPTCNFRSALGAAYSNWNIALVGHWLARESGQPFEEYVQQHVFDRLGMRRSSFSHPDDPRRPWPREWKDDLAKGHRFLEGSTSNDQVSCPPGGGSFEPQEGFEYSLLGPAEGLSTTAADMAKFMRMHLPADDADPEWKSVLSKEAIRYMQGPRLGPHVDHPEFNAGGLGFYETHRRARRLVMHSGNTFWSNAAVVLMPEERFGVFVAVNSPVGHMPLDNFVKYITNTCFDEPEFPAPPPAVPLARYEGEYWSNARNFTTNEKFLLQFNPSLTIELKDNGNGMLVARNLMGNESQWAPISEHVFRSVKGGPSQEVIAFEVVNGEATHVLGPKPFEPARKLAWHETPSLHEHIRLFAQAFFAAMLVWVGARFRRSESPLGSRMALWLGAGLAASNSIAIFVLQRAFSTPKNGTVPELAFGYPCWVLAALGVLQLAVPLTLGVVVCAVLAWRRAYWSPAGRFFYAGFACVALVFLWSMHFWNLIGWRLS